MPNDTIQVLEIWFRSKEPCIKKLNEMKWGIYIPLIWLGVVHILRNQLRGGGGGGGGGFQMITLV